MSRLFPRLDADPCPAQQGSKIVRLIYLDESGRASETDQPIFVVAAVLVHADAKWRAVDISLERIVNTLVPESARASFEFHAKNLFSGSDKYPWGQEIRHAILKECLQIIGQYELPVVWSGIHKTGFKIAAKGMYDPAKLEGEEFLKELQRLGFVACAIEIEQWFLKNAADEVGLCLADVTKAGLGMKQELREYRRRAILPDGPRFDHLVDTVYFGNSDESIGLQLADCCAYFISRHLMGKMDSEPFYDLIKDCVRPTSIRFLI